jgi:alpha-L-rhamnosidase
MALDGAQRNMTTANLRAWVRDRCRVSIVSIVGLALLAPILAPLTTQVTHRGGTDQLAIAASLQDGQELLGKPIWALDETQSEAVALFRHSFSLSTEIDQAELSIIADTRYEVWLDGTWLGRGPARFSRVRQEFDTYTLDSMAAGSHLLAVLVQYAPNTRRSESSQPALQASLRGGDGLTREIVAATSTDWKATLSPAWDAQARSISQLDLIGPMELLDLRQLPADWMQPGFDDSAWPWAREVMPSPFPALSARTIPLLVEHSRLPVSVIETGLLSPGWQLVELEHPTGAEPAIVQNLTIVAAAPTTLKVEAVESNPVSVDGSPPLTWEPLSDPRRPDVLRAEYPLAAGYHTLGITVPPELACPAVWTFSQTTQWAQAMAALSCTLTAGRTLAISLDGVQLSGQPGVVQTHDPGRRMLLANPNPGGTGSPTVQLLAEGATAYIPPGNTPRYVVLDFGRTLHARLSLEADGPAGTLVDAGWDERLTEGRPLPNPGSLLSHLWSQVDSWVLDGTPRRLATLDARSGRYLLLQVLGPGPVYLRQIQALEETYPVTQTGQFSSSDALLDQIWQVGVDTLVPNMTDAYTDTPWRERGQWWADAMISFQINQAAFGDLALLRRGLRQMADAIDAEGRPTPLAPNGAGAMILDFGMQWVEGLYLYWTLSEDLDLVEELYPAAQRLVGFLETYAGSSGLLDVPPIHWSQSVLIDWSAASSRSGESTAVNAQYAGVLRQMADLATALGMNAQAQSYQDRSTAVQTAINTVLFLPDQGSYAASRLNGEIVSPSIHAQAWALRYDVVPAERRSSTVEALIGRLSPFFGDKGWSVVEPLGMYGVLEALGDAGQTGEAMGLIRERYGDLLAQGATTWWELFTPNQTRSNSLSHAWGGSPTWFLSSHVLGGTATGPAEWRVAPHPGNLTYAQGSVPLGTDVLGIDWQHPQCGKLELTVNAPAGSEGSVLLPVTRHDAKVTLNGITIWQDGQVAEQPIRMTERGLWIESLTGGDYAFSVSFECYRSFLPYVVQ